MAKEIEIIVNNDGSYSCEGYNLKPGEKIEDVVKWLTDKLGPVTSRGHKHTHTAAETTKNIAKN